MAIKKVMHRVLIGTRAEIFGETGDYASQEAFATDYAVSGQPGLCYVWNGTVWVLPNYQQKVGQQYTDVSCDNDTLEKTLYTCALPPLGIRDSVIDRLGWDMSAHASNTKRLRVKTAGTEYYNQTFTNNESDVRDIFFRNRGATNSQISGHGNGNVYGSSGADLGTSAIQTNVATTHIVTGQKSVNTEVMTLRFAETFVCGGGT